MKAATSAAVAKPPLPRRRRRRAGAGPATTLVLYDTSSDCGWLGELYALAGGTLASHFGQVTAEPVADYVAGQVADHTALVYLGSTYDEPLPATLLNDVVTTTKPVIWVGYNIWQASRRHRQHRQRRVPGPVRLGPGDVVHRLHRPDGVGGVQGPDADPLGAQRRRRGRAAPGECGRGQRARPGELHQRDRRRGRLRADRADHRDQPPVGDPVGNLTYLGEIPFPYMSESDRMLVFADLLFAALAPTATAEQAGRGRLEDVNPTSDPTTLRRFADYLSGQGVPFTVGVIPEYDDPTGFFSGGVPQKITLAQRPTLVSALKYMVARGGTLIQHGTTHQFSNVDNPYNGVSGDDFEFYRSRCSTTQNPPYNFRPARVRDHRLGHPAGRAAGRLDRVGGVTGCTTGRSLFGAAGLATPTIFETPHYSATAADYAGMRQVYPTRYERELYFGGLLTGATDPTHVFGQFFPYSVHDVYGTAVLPENLGNYEPELFNNNPPRSPAGHRGQRPGEPGRHPGRGQFLLPPGHDPLTQPAGDRHRVKGLGYTFVSPATLMATNG